MAGASQSHISKEKLTDDFLSCSLCLESYKQPKVLHCQHTFCLVCLQRLMGTCYPGMVICCPLCRENTVIASGDLKSLKTNFIIESLLNFIARSATCGYVPGMEWSGQKVEKYCQLCEDKKAAEVYCDDCQIWLCKVCSITHGKLPTTKTHRTMSVPDIIAKAKEKLKTVEKEFQKLHNMIEEKHQEELMEQDYMAEQAQNVASQIETAWEKLLALLSEKKCDLLQEIAIRISQAETKQGLKITQLKENSQRIKKGLEYVRDMGKSNDAHHITNMMGDVDALRKSVSDVTLSQECFPRHEVEFQSVESLAQTIRGSKLGSLHHGNLLVEQAEKFPHDKETEGELVHRLAYNYFITGMAYANQGMMFVASNCQKIKRMGSKMYEEDIPNVTKPWGVLKLQSAELIITDCGKNIGAGSVNIFDLSGKFVRMISAGLSLPRGIAVDSHNRVYVCDEVDRCVYIMTLEGRIVHIIKFSWDGNFLFDAPRFVAVNSDGHVFVSDAGKFVKIFDDSFQLVKTYRSPFARSEFWDISIDSANFVFIADWKHGVHVLTAEGNFKGFLKEPSNGITIKEPTALCLHGNTKALMVGTSNGEVFAVKSKQ